MAMARFLPTWMGGEADRVDGGGVYLPMKSVSAAEPATAYTVSAGLPGQPDTTAVQMATCGWCGGYHSGTCPKVKAIEYHPDGTVKRVEFISDEGETH